MHNVIAILLIVAGSVVFANIALPISQDEIIPPTEEWDFPFSGSVESETGQSRGYDDLRLRRPKEFLNPGHIRNYLDVVGKNYGIRKASRFGKRAFTRELKYTAGHGLNPLKKNDN